MGTRNEDSVGTMGNSLPITSAKAPVPHFWMSCKKCIDVHQSGSVLSAQM